MNDVVIHLTKTVYLIRRKDREMTRQEAIEVLHHTIAFESGFAEAKRMAIEALSEPTLVRCGECEYCKDELIEEYMPLYIYCEKWNHETDFDGFCSAGERIDNE